MLLEMRYYFLRYKWEDRNAQQVPTSELLYVGHVGALATGVTFEDASTKRGDLSFTLRCCIIYFTAEFGCVTNFHEH